MLRALRNILRLLTIARTLQRHGALEPLSPLIEGAGLAPAVLLIGRVLTRPRSGAGSRAGQRLAAALSELGPAFIKLGQMLSTRADLLGDEVAVDLAMLRDRLPPFPAAEARAMVEKELGQPIADLFTSFEDIPVSAASIAQVHYATTADAPPGGEVAVKILRPGIEHAFARDVDLLRWLARLVERTQPKLRRLKPVAVVETFAETVRMEMDLRLEAAAASELAANFAGDPSYRVPAVDWRRTARRVMTQQRLTGIALGDRDALLAAGHDIPSVLAKAAAIFFNQVFRDGYFHADQHPGNMFVDADGNIGAVDFGIMGRLDRKTRYYLADTLLGFLERDYCRVAEVQFAAGFVPADQSLAEFTQACRSIGEPIFGRSLDEISFAQVLGQLLRLSEAFEMEAQPQLLLLQKNMLMAEGVSRQLNPALNIWTLAQPLVADWMRENRGPEARIAEGVRDLARIAGRLPELVADMETIAGAARRGFRIDPDTMAALRHLNNEDRRSLNWHIWLAAALVALVLLILR